MNERQLPRLSLDFPGGSRQGPTLGSPRALLGLRRRHLHSPRPPVRTRLRRGVRARALPALNQLRSRLRGQWRRRRTDGIRLLSARQHSGHLRFRPRSEPLQLRLPLRRRGARMLVRNPGRDQRLSGALLPRPRQLPLRQAQGGPNSPHHRLFPLLALRQLRQLPRRRRRRSSRGALVERRLPSQQGRPDQQRCTGLRCLGSDPAARLANYEIEAHFGYT